jgi:DHA1 family bicyclomycin/chloramphenicol resistance-like MFS transporter
VLVNWRWLPETLPAQAQPFALGPLLRGYAQLVPARRFLALVLASGIPFNGMFLYVLAAPVFLGEHLQLAPTQFFWFFVCTIGGIMGGAWASGRLAGRVTPRHQIRWGFRADDARAVAQRGAERAGCRRTRCGPCLPVALLPSAGR